MATNDIVNADTLRKAATLVEAGNWCQNAWAKARNGRQVEPEHPGACKFCAVSAILKSEDPRFANGMDAVIEVGRQIDMDMGIKIDRGSGRGIVLIWNDDPDRTKDQVAALFRKTADRLHPDPEQKELL